MEAHAPWLLTLIEKQPDLTLDEVVSAMHKHGIAGSRTAVWSFFKRHNISFKKSLRAAEQDRPDVARARRCWKRRQAMLNSTRLVFIDETAANTKMVRLSGRCPRGERLVGCVPQGHWKTLTFVAGLRRNGMTAPCVIDGSMSGKTFLAMSSSLSLLRSNATTSWSWTIFRHTKFRAYAKRSKPEARRFAICPSTHRT